MKIAAIISEYNPFHNGHLYQIRKIREELGEDTAIIAVMSGNFTQRGQTAILDKWIRAESAVLEGVNLAVEIPFPFSISSAEFYAKSGVKTAGALGADYISFGSECGDISILNDIAENMLSNEFQSAFHSLLHEKENKQHGYAKLAEYIYISLFGEPKTKISSPNNILAIEYIKAAKVLKANIKTHTVQRIGAGYNEKNLVCGDIQSATYLREEIDNNFFTASKYIPQNAFNKILSAKKEGMFPCLEDRLSSAIITNLRLKRSNRDGENPFGDSGLYNRLINSSFKANNIQSLIKLTDTKKYTESRIRRVMWYSLFGVTSSDVRELPKYTQVLAMDKVGQAILKNAKKASDFSILTKPSAFKKLGEDALRQKSLSDIADSVFELTKPKLTDGNSSLTKTPFILK